MIVEITPEHISAVGLAISSVIGAIAAWQANEVKKLRTRVSVLEAQAESDRQLFRMSIKFIRDLLSHIAQLTLLLRHHAPDADVPNPPAAPAELQAEI